MACVITLPHTAHAVQRIQHYTCQCLFIGTLFELDYMQNKHNVGMVQCVSKYTCSCMEKHLVKKLYKQGGAFLDIATHVQFPQVDIRVSVATQSTFAAVKTHFGYTFTISIYIWQPFDAARPCVLLCFIALVIY